MTRTSNSKKRFEIFRFTRLAAASFFLIFCSAPLNVYAQQNSSGLYHDEINGQGTIQRPSAADNGFYHDEINGQGTTQPPPPDQSVPVTGKKDVEEKASCETVSEITAHACNTPGTAGMDPGSSAMYTMMMNQLVTTGAQIAGVGKNMSQQCKLQADISKIMGSINGVKGSTCAAMISKCSKSCDEQADQYNDLAETYDKKPETQAAAAEYRKAARASRRKETDCKSYSGQVGAMMMGAMQNLGNFAANTQCMNDLAAYTVPTVPTSTPLQFPTVGDCSDPNNQSLGCFCGRAANAQTPICAGFGNKDIFAGGGTTTTPNGGTITAPTGGTIADSTDGNTVDPFANLKKDANGDQKGQGDGGSGAPGGGGLSALSSEGGGMGGAGDTRSAITGTSGGQGNGLGSAGGGGGSGGLARNNGTAGKEGFFDKFNLKKFLPGSKYKTRGIAGMSVKSVDGITGPMGPTLWEKATRQYQEQIQKQNVILDK